MKRGGLRPDGSCKHKLNQRGPGPLVRDVETEVCGDCGMWRFAIVGTWMPEEKLLEESKA
jgi:hypothetical protein